LVPIADSQAPTPKEIAESRGLSALRACLERQRSLAETLSPPIEDATKRGGAELSEKQGLPPETTAEGGDRAPEVSASSAQETTSQLDTEIQAETEIQTETASQVETGRPSDSDGSNGQNRAAGGVETSTKGVFFFELPGGPEEGHDQGSSRPRGPEVPKPPPAKVSTPITKINGLKFEGGPLWATVKYFFLITAIIGGLMVFLGKSLDEPTFGLMGPYRFFLTLGSGYMAHICFMGNYKFNRFKI
jgi:hypothetical protein